MAQAPPTALLERCPLLEGVGQTARRQLLASGRERALAAGETLLARGVRSEEMYFLLEGQLGVYFDEAEDSEAGALIEAGQTVGELGVMAGQPASARVCTESAVTLLAVREDAFWALINTSHAFAVNLLALLTDRLRQSARTVSASSEERRHYQRAAMFDGLTGIHNRRWLDETLHRLVERHRRDGCEALCVALIDIDHFKQFNDRYGHDAGDHVLTEVASLLAANVRPTDLAARFGGEEFVVLFPDTEMDDAVTVAERLRVAVAGLDAALDGEALPQVTISLGLAQLRQVDEVPTLLKRADEAMYRAKRAGRNRVIHD